MRISLSLTRTGLLKSREQIEFTDSHTDYSRTDIMDGHSVPNLTPSSFFVGQVKKPVDKSPDYHLMVTCPQGYATQLVRIGADFIILCPEIVNGQTFRLIGEIYRHGMKVEPILNPETPIEAMERYIYKADRITVMIADLGPVGQPFVPKMLDKVIGLKTWREQKDSKYETEVDSLCSQVTYEKPMAAGVDVFTIGASGLFDHVENIDKA